MVITSSATIEKFDPRETLQPVRLEQDTVIEGIKVPRHTWVIRGPRPERSLLRLLILARPTLIQGKFYAQGSSVTFHPNGRVAQGRLVDGREVHLDPAGNITRIIQRQNP